MTTNLMTFIRLAALVGLTSLCGVYLTAQQCGGPGGGPSRGDQCYDLMIDWCNQQASNAAEGGWDVAYDACTADWLANSSIRCPTPCATGSSAKESRSVADKRQRPARK